MYNVPVAHTYSTPCCSPDWRSTGESLVLHKRYEPKHVTKNIYTLPFDHKWHFCESIGFPSNAVRVLCWDNSLTASDSEEVGF